MSQFSLRLVVWFVVILLLLVGTFLQVRSARGATLAEHPAIAANTTSTPLSLSRF